MLNFVTCHSLDSPSQEAEQAAQALREMRPNVSNSSQILHLMNLTFSIRQSWMTADKPSITDITRRFPRLLDVPDTVCIFLIC